MVIATWHATLFLHCCLWLLGLAFTAAGGPHWPKVQFFNDSPMQLTMYWLASDTDLRELASVDPGEGTSQDTHLGHRFRLLPTAEKAQVAAGQAVSTYAQVEVTGQGIARIKFEDSKLEAIWSELSVTKPKGEVSAAVLELGKEKAEECVRNLEAAVASGRDPQASIEDAEVFCRNFQHRELISSKTEITYEQWKKTMAKPWKLLKDATDSQPAALRNFTISGFKLLRRHEPDGRPPHGGLLEPPFQKNIDAVIDWYEKYRTSAKPEEHGLYDPSVSSYESDTWILMAPKNLYRPVVKEIQAGLERWAGLPSDSLQFINFYGPRFYRNNSILRRHVDIWETHVLSAIVSVGKRGLMKPWPLDIVHHDGSKHQVDDSPGDVIFYESATCAHSRDSSFLNGREVANMFAHFRPKIWEPLPGSHLQSNAGKVVHHPVEL